MGIVILYLTFMSSLILGFFGRFIGIKGAIFVSVVNMFSCFIISLYVFYEVGYLGINTELVFFNWFSLSVLCINWGFLFDSLSCLMLVIVTSISLLVHIYSISYMSKDPHQIRFMCYLSLFTFFMLFMVTSNNYVQFFFGWEGVGLVSYLLVNFWYTRVQANKSALKAIIVNKFGDFSLALAILGVFRVYKSFDITLVNSLTAYTTDVTFFWFNSEVSSTTFISFFIILAAVGKSAQLGLHTWLPDAMEGPTPVSALIHAATMVTAGIFLLVRSSYIIEFSSFTSIIVVILGTLTCIFSGTVGCCQNDFKKVIAYSTCSQLGYMFLTCGLAHYSLCMFHLMNHAYFKALLFLGAGSVIHGLSDEQDIGYMGGLGKLLPLTYSTFLIGSLTLMGTPFLSGFYSKDMILELTTKTVVVEGLFSNWLSFLGALLTTIYSVRLLLIVYSGGSGLSRYYLFNVHECDKTTGFVLITLSLLSNFTGYLLFDLMVGLGTDFWGNSFYKDKLNLGEIDLEFLDVISKNLPIYCSIFISLLILYYYNNTKYFFFNINTKFFAKKWYFDLLYNYYIVRSTLYFGYSVTFKVIDRGLVEYVGPTGLVLGVRNLLIKVLDLQSGYIYNYVYVILLWVNVSVLYIYFINIYYTIEYKVLILLLLVVFYDLIYNINLGIDNLYRIMKKKYSTFRIVIIEKKRKR